MENAALKPSQNSSFGGTSASNEAAGRLNEMKTQVGDALDRGRSGVADSAQAAKESASEDLAKLRADFAALQQTVSKFASEAGGEAMQTARNVGGAVASQVGSAASDIAAAGAQQAKTFAAELETRARSNPLGMLAATLVVGVVVGMMSRGRA